MWPHPYRSCTMLIEEAECEDADILNGVYHHHERLNDKGYFKISGNRITLIARIIAVSDVFDTITHPHSNGYEPKTEKQAALELMQDDGLDSFIVKIFIDMMGLKDVYEQYRLR